MSPPVTTPPPIAPELPPTPALDAEPLPPPPEPGRDGRAIERLEGSVLDVIRRSTSTVEALRDAPTRLERQIGERTLSNEVPAPASDRSTPEADLPPPTPSERKFHVRPTSEGEAGGFDAVRRPDRTGSIATGGEP